MELHKRLKKIKQLLKKEKFHSRQHFKTKCSERRLDPTDVKDVLKKGNIKGIVEQSENKYKIWFKWNTDKDINVILIIVNDRIRFITIWPCFSAKRERE